MGGRGPGSTEDPVRRNRKAASTRLPAEGRKGDPPPWPLRPDITLQARLEFLQGDQQSIEAALDATDDPKEANRLRYRLGKNVEAIALTEAVIRNANELELELWTELWHTPQAVAWERLRWTRTVAQYARWKAKAELGDLNASKEARMLEDRLGLTPRSLKDLQWSIVEDEVAKKRTEPGSSARSRIKAV